MRLVWEGGDNEDSVPDVPRRLSADSKRKTDCQSCIQLSSAGIRVMARDKKDRLRSFVGYRLARLQWPEEKWLLDGS